MIFCFWHTLCLIGRTTKTRATKKALRLWHNKNKTTERKQTDFFGEGVPFRAPATSATEQNYLKVAPALVGSVHDNGKTSVQKNLFAFDPASGRLRLAQRARSLKTTTDRSRRTTTHAMILGGELRLPSVLSAPALCGALPGGGAYARPVRPSAITQGSLV